MCMWSTQQHEYFFFSPLAKNLSGEDDVANDFATYLINEAVCRRSMNEDGKDL